jgi:rfaE bifunctional protein nucleotidyltransferase chain/domain
MRVEPKKVVLRDREELARVIARRRGAAGERVVLANGCLDLLHAGHVRFLEAASLHGDLLVVALNSDASARGLKGAGRPVMPLEERAELIGALRCVDYVTWFDEPDLERTLRLLLPDVHAKGTDYDSSSVPEAAVDEELGVQVIICGDPKDHSSSELLERLSGRDAEA